MQDGFQITQQRQKIAQAHYDWDRYSALIAGRDAARAGRSNVPPPYADQRLVDAWQHGVSDVHNDYA